MNTNGSGRAERAFSFGNGSTVTLMGTDSGQVGVLVETPEGARLVRIPSDVALQIATAMQAEAAWAEAQEPTHFVGGCRVFQRRDGFWTREGHADRWPTKYGQAGASPRSCLKMEGLPRRPALSSSTPPAPACPNAWSAPLVVQNRGEADAARL